MQFAFLLPILPILAASAVPVASNFTDITLEADDALVVLSDGELHLMKQDEVESFAASLAIDPDYVGTLEEPSDTANESIGNDTSDSLDANSNLVKRGGWGDVSLMVPGKRVTFDGWDVAMSPVVQAKTDEVSIAITSGQLIADTIGGGGGFTLTLVKDFLQVNGNANYAHTTTSSVSGTVTFKIPKGYYGAVVSNPLTHREYGWQWNGRPGQANAAFWYSDKFEDATFAIGEGQVHWVKGVITTCLGKKHPLPRCTGKGFLE